MNKTVTIWVMMLAISIGGLFGFSHTVNAQSFDSDGDTLTDEEERTLYFTDPNDADTDRDGYTDGEEIRMDYSPHLGDGAKMNESDHDGDGLNDWLERWFGSSIGTPDTDGDGKSDLDEVMRGGDPTGIRTGTPFADSRKILVDNSSQQLSFLVDTVKIKSFPVSTGNPRTPTPTGSFTVQRMVPMKNYVGADYFIEDVPWNLQFIPLYFIHAAFWHNDFGVRTHSRGCVNMTTEDAKFLYEYAEVGMPVEVIGQTPRYYYVGT